MCRAPQRLSGALICALLLTASASVWLPVPVAEARTRLGVQEAADSGAPTGADDQDAVVFSGPQPGEPVAPLTINRLQDPASGSSHDVVAAAGNGPLVIVFVHERTRPAFGLASAVMKFAATRRPQGLTAATVFLTADPTETRSWLQRIQQLLPADVTIGISPDGREGPGAYGLNRNVALTIIVAREGRVTNNFALVQPGLDADGPAILKAIVEITGGGEVPPISAFGPGSRMQGQNKPSSQKGRAAAQTEQQDPMLRTLLSPLIRKDATEQQVEAAAQAIVRYVADHPQAGRQISEIAQRIIDADKLTNYGTPKAQQYLKAWAAEFRTDPSPAAAAAAPAPPASAPGSPNPPRETRGDNRP